jgi:LuxR family transcriptional regulator, maltose regulon positive regulatory protein
MGAGARPGHAAIVLRKPSEREQAVLQLLSRGLTYDQIAGSLGISVNTVRTHVRALYDKLEVSSRVQAVMRALSRRWLVR